MEYQELNHWATYKTTALCSVLFFVLWNMLFKQVGNPIYIWNQLLLILTHSQVFKVEPGLNFSFFSLSCWDGKEFIKSLRFGSKSDDETLFFGLFLGLTELCSGLIHGSVLRDYLWWGLGHHIKCLRLNLGKPLARKTRYPLVWIVKHFQARSLLQVDSLMKSNPSHLTELMGPL